jgi:hypothetical protein
VAEVVGGFSLDGYSGFERIGRGGFSVVHRARHDRLGREVAVKVLSTDLSDPADRRRFETECLVMGRLGRHRHVVDVHDAGVSPTGHPYIVMKLYPGGTLADRIKAEGPMSVADVVDVGTNLVSALAAAHAEAVVHRDVKPENVLIDEAGEPVVTDFGVAAVADPDGRMTSSIAFSRSYVAPEVLDRNAYGTASDIYSLGATLYTMLSGRPVFEATTEARTVMAVLQDPPAPIGRDDVPPELEAVVMRCLAKAPADRYATAAEIGEALVAAVVAPVQPPVRVTPSRPVASPADVVDPALASGNTLSVPGTLAEVAEDGTVLRHPTRPEVQEPVTLIASRHTAAGEPTPPAAAHRTRGASGSRRRWLVVGAASAALLLVGGTAWGVVHSRGTPAAELTPATIAGTFVPTPQFDRLLPAEFGGSSTVTSEHMSNYGQVMKEMAPNQFPGCETQVKEDNAMVARLQSQPVLEVHGAGAANGDVNRYQIDWIDAGSDAAAQQFDATSTAVNECLGVTFSPIDASRLFPAGGYLIGDGTEFAEANVRRGPLLMVLTVWTPTGSKRGPTASTLKTMMEIIMTQALAGKQSS